MATWRASRAVGRSQGTTSLAMWLQVTHAHTCFLCSLSPLWAGAAGRQTGFYQETQVSRKTIKEIWIDQILHPSRKQNCVQICSKLSSDESSGHHMLAACLWEDLPSCSRTEVQHEVAGLPASLIGLRAHFGKESPLKGIFPAPQHCWACELLHTHGYLVL